VIQTSHSMIRSYVSLMLRAKMGLSVVFSAAEIPFFFSTTQAT
jgi:hypothetical protein